MEKHLHFVSSNNNKIIEAQKILGFPIQPIHLEIDEIQSLNLSEIITKKAQEAFNRIQQPLIVDDISLSVEAWNGFPGPFIKFLREAGGNELLIQMLKHEKNRKVIARAVIGFHDGSRVHIFIGEKKGTVAQEPKGENSWGWDPIFIPDHSTKTYAQLTEEEKNTTSHRFLALQKFKKYLEEKDINFS